MAKTLELGVRRTIRPRGNRMVFYVAAALAGDIPGNLRRAEQWLHALRTSHPSVCFVAPWITAVRAGADDGSPEARELGLRDAEAVIARCDGIVLCGEHLSSGMIRERDAAILSGLVLVRLTSLEGIDELATHTVTRGIP